jgi:hypothetical protein
MRSRPATRRVPRAKSVRRWRWTLSRSRQSSTNPGLRKARCGRLRLPTRSPQGSYPRRSYHARIRDRCRCSGCESNTSSCISALPAPAASSSTNVTRVSPRPRGRGRQDRRRARQTTMSAHRVSQPESSRQRPHRQARRPSLGGIWKPLRRLHRSGRSSSGTVRSPRTHTPVHNVGYDKREGHILGDVRLEPSDN